MFYRFVHAVLGILFRAAFRFRVSGREHVPPGGALVCGNHTAASDPVLVALALRPEDHPYFMAKIELFRFFALRWVITALGAYPIERGKNDLQAVKTSLKLLGEGKKVLMFPQGTRVPSDEAMAVKAGAAMLALRSGAPILPVFISEGRKPFFNRIEVRIGKPFWAEKRPGQGKARAYEEISDRLVAEILALSGPGRKGTGVSGGKPA